MSLLNGIIGLSMYLPSYFASITWNPSRVAFTIPFIDLQMFWYSIFFALGLIGAYYITSAILLNDHRHHAVDEQDMLRDWIDRLVIWVFVGILIGARLGHILFYDFDHFWLNPEEIFMTWKGGLASHGGAIGALLSAFIFWKRNPAPCEVSWKEFLDAAAIGSAWTATSIRIGNFFNQEIIGEPTSLPWGILFEDPMDSPLVREIPCHPVQLYEAIVSFSLLILLIAVRKKIPKSRAGYITGIYLVILFSFRILLEAFKLPQSSLDTKALHMGQILSVPFIILGCYFVWTSKKTS